MRATLSLWKPHFFNVKYIQKEKYSNPGAFNNLNQTSYMSDKLFKSKNVPSSEEAFTMIIF